ncbi:serine hydrolase domain-containing protein [Jiulongibacter sp. NS-SX5]|uniref:serine hydrolase domain-containing protein n=1 Tax=Jiulongibacter sp. NS-SX5 TaxID=3463854 RepID=UPI0040588054
MLRLTYFLLASVVLLCSCEQTKKVEEPDLEEIKRLEQARIDSIKTAIHFEEKKVTVLNAINKKLKAGFNGAVLVQQAGITLLDTAVGMARIKDNLPLTNNSAFQLASLSKTFTAISILKLVEQGKLNLNLTVKDYYPEFPYDGVTIRSLLSHRSGLPYYEYTFDQKARQEKSYPNNQELIEWFAQANPRPKPYNLPDHYFSYNNTNFAILAAIVEKVSKQDFNHFLRDEIFQPLGMSSSFTARDLNDSIPNAIRTYGYQNGREIPFDIYDNVLGDKGVFSTTADLSKWYQALSQEKVVSKEMLREAYTPRSFEYPGLRNYGYGFRLWLNEKQQTDYVYHTGWWKGYNTIMFFDLREDFVIILLSNKYNRSVYHIKEVIDALHGGKRETSVEENILDE